MKALNIAEHWDTAGIITADSDPEQEFAIWQGCPEFAGDEFTLSDFQEYIASLA